jgi:hypothetical protein
MISIKVDTTVADGTALCSKESGEGGAMPRVSFAGATAGTEVLTWGQQVVWQAVDAYVPGEQARSLAVAVPAPADLPVQDMSEAVRALVVRHEPLRTTFRSQPDGPVQDVAGAGTITVVRIEGGAGALADAVARAGTLHFPLDRPLVDIAFIEEHDVAPAVVLGLSHLAVDAWGAQVVAHDLDRLLRGRQLDPVSLQPRQRARWERSPDGRRLSDRGITHWQRALATYPATPIPGVRPTGARPRVRGVLRVAALPVALAATASVMRLTPPSAVLAALALVLAARAGTDQPYRFGCRLTVGHRFPPLPADYAGTAVQHAPLVFDVHPHSFAATARAALPALLAASRHTQADPVATGAVADEVARDRGLRWDWVEVNVVSRPGRRGAGGPDGFTPLPTGEAGGPLELEVVGDALQVAADPAVLAPGELEPLLRAVAAVLLDAAGLSAGVASRA